MKFSLLFAALPLLACSPEDKVPEYESRLSQAVCDFDTQEDKRCHWVATMSAATPRTPTPRNSDVAPGYTSLD